MVEGQGTGKLTFGGVNINNPPYYAHLAYETKYWFLDGFESTQFVTSPTSLISTKPYLKDWLITAVLRVIAPDRKRATLLRALASLAHLFDPTAGEKQLIFDEFPNSFFLAKLQHSNLSNETQSPFMADIDITFACTGPAYSTTENVQTNNPPAFVITAYGDSPASPRFRYTRTGSSYSGDFIIANNTTGEQITWNGTLNTNDVLDIVLDPEHGTPFSIFKNGQLSMTTVTGPAWPHLAPGENEIYVTTGGYTGTIETRWRNRWFVGEREETLRTPTAMTLTVSNSTPVIGNPLTFNAYLTSWGTPLSEPIIIYYYLGTTRYIAYQGSTNAQGHYTVTGTATRPGSRAFYAEFAGDATYAPVASNAVTVSTSATTRMLLSASTTTPKATVTPVVFTATLQWYDPSTSTWLPALTGGIQVKLWHTDLYGTYTDELKNIDASGQVVFASIIFGKVRSYYYYAVSAADPSYPSAQSAQLVITASA